MTIGDRVRYIGSLPSLKNKRGTILTRSKGSYTSYCVAWDNWHDGHNAPSNIPYDPVHGMSCFFTFQLEPIETSISELLAKELK